MNVLIVDDEAPARERLAQLIGDLGDCRVVGGAGDGDEALSQATRCQPDVVLMDIRMPGMDGVEAARRLSEHPQPPAIIFVTAYHEHALDAFDAQAVDYLVKPVRRERLDHALRRARRPNRAQLDALAGPNASTPARGEPARDHVLCRRRGNLELIPLDDIFYFRADNKYVTVRHRNGEDLIEDSLRQLEDDFGARFLRIHRNALVATAQLGRLEKHLSGRRYLTLRDLDKPLEVSRRHVASVRRALRERGESTDA